MTGIGPVAVRQPRVRDRTGTGEERIRFTSAIWPPYARRSKSLEVLIPILYLKGISTGDFEEADCALSRTPSIRPTSSFLRLAFPCRLFGNLLRTLAVLCTPQRYSRVLGQTSGLHR
jgi:hypothetical protein